MFRTNEGHLQPYLIINFKDLPKKHRKRLDKSWAGVFYTGIFCQLVEELYDHFIYNMQLREVLG